MRFIHTRTQSTPVYGAAAASQLGPMQPLHRLLFVRRAHVCGVTAASGNILAHHIDMTSFAYASPAPKAHPIKLFPLRIYLQCYQRHFLFCPGKKS